MDGQNSAPALAPVDLNRATSISDEQLDDVMNYHMWTKEQIEKGDRIRLALGIAIKTVIENVPPSPDRSTAIRKLRDARMDCNSAITHHGKF